MFQPEVVSKINENMKCDLASLWKQSDKPY
jgi:hypothetical protein